MTRREHALNLDCRNNSIGVKKIIGYTQEKSRAEVQWKQKGCPSVSSLSIHSLNNDKQPVQCDVSFFNSHPSSNKAFKKLDAGIGRVYLLNIRDRGPT